MCGHARVGMHIFLENTSWWNFIIFCYVAMDDDEFHSNAESVNGESEDEFAMNSEDNNNSDSLNDGEVISLLDFVYLCTYVL